ncbi:type VII secretion-associated serine protease mycosin [Kitasatospora sp. NPDC005748]|uniref:type VII secretion-associated serine protease mycosin n=1 Tax=Kitasatospora sp. NPDC005748 TaxID=3157063 RepID=UPI0033C613A6
MIAGPAALPAAAVDSIRAQQWHLDAMKAPDMWKTTKGEGVTVAVIDGGFKLDHPDLVGQLLPGKDFSGLPGGIGDFKDGHGTGIASLIAGTGKGMGGQGAYGLAPGAKVLPLKIKNDSNAGSVSTSDFLDRIGQAITYAADQGAKVINISQAGPALQASSESVASVNSAIAHAVAKGSLVVAGVGNSAQAGNPVEYPAALPSVVGVGAIDQNITTTAESEQGPQVDLVAPGIDMYDACTGASGYCKTHGTSDATAIVSASAALLWSVHPDWSANQVLRVLINTAGKPADGSNRNDGIGYGAVRPRIALTTPGDPGPADVSPIPEKAVEAPSASPSAAPSPSASAPTGASAAASAPQTANSAPVAAPPAAQPPAAEASDSGSALPIVVAVVVGLVLVAGVVFLVLRRRGAATAAPAVEAPPAPVGYPQAPPQAGPGVPPGPPGPPSYGPPAPPSDNPYAR